MHPRSGLISPSASLRSGATLAAVMALAACGDGAPAVTHGGTSPAPSASFAGSVAKSKALAELAARIEPKSHTSPHALTPAALVATVDGTDAFDVADPSKVEEYLRGIERYRVTTKKRLLQSVSAHDMMIMLAVVRVAEIAGPKSDSAGAHILAAEACSTLVAQLRQPKWGIAQAWPNHEASGAEEVAKMVEAARGQAAFHRAELLRSRDTRYHGWLFDGMARDAMADDDMALADAALSAGEAGGFDDRGMLSARRVNYWAYKDEPEKAMAALGVAKAAFVKQATPPRELLAYSWEKELLPALAAASSSNASTVEAAIMRHDVLRDLGRTDEAAALAKSMMSTHGGDARVRSRAGIAMFEQQIASIWLLDSPNVTDTSGILALVAAPGITHGDLRLASATFMLKAQRITPHIMGMLGSKDDKARQALRATIVDLRADSKALGALAPDRGAYTAFLLDRLDDFAAKYRGDAEDVVIGFGKHAPEAYALAERYPDSEPLHELAVGMVVFDQDAQRALAFLTRTQKSKSIVPAIKMRERVRAGLVAVLRLGTPEAVAAVEALLPTGDASLTTMTLAVGEVAMFRGDMEALRFRVTKKIDARDAAIQSYASAASDNTTPMRERYRAANNYAYLLAEAGKRDEALAAFDQVNKQNDASAIFARLNTVLLGSSTVEVARAELTKLRAAATDDETARDAMTRWLYALATPAELAERKKEYDKVFSKAHFPVLDTRLGVLPKGTLLVAGWLQVPPQHELDWSTRVDGSSHIWFVDLANQQHHLGAAWLPKTLRK